MHNVGAGMIGQYSPVATVAAAAAAAAAAASRASTSAPKNAQVIVMYFAFFYKFSNLLYRISNLFNINDKWPQEDVGEIIHTHTH